MNEGSRGEVLRLRDSVLSALEGSSCLEHKMYAVLLVLKGIGITMDQADGIEQEPMKDLIKRQMHSPTLGGMCSIAAESVPTFIRTMNAHVEKGSVPSPRDLAGGLYEAD